MAWSDPCSTFVGGNRSLNTCSFSDVDGADNGNLTINSGQTVTLQASATLAFNSGKSLTINGAISVASTAQIKKTNLWITDVDADTYPPSVGLTAQDSQPAGKQRAYVTTSTLDCYDGNADANPSSGISASVHRGDGSFDYDCDGLETQTELRQSDTYCTDNGTIYPTPKINAQTDPGWCSLVVSGPGGTNYPLCNLGSVPACGGSNDWYTYNIYSAPQGCVQGNRYGGVYTETKYEKCY